MEENSEESRHSLSPDPRQSLIHEPEFENALEISLHCPNRPEEKRRALSRAAARLLRPSLGDRDLSEERALVHPEDRGSLEEIAISENDGGRPVLLRWIGDDGEIVWTKVRLRPGGNPGEVVLRLRNVTPSKRSESGGSDPKGLREKLIEAERSYRDIFENAVEGIFQTAPDGHYLKANPALARIYGYDSPAELIRSITDIEKQLYANPEMRLRFQRIMRKRGAVSGFVAEIYRKDGERIWISETARAVRDESGEILYYEGTVQDITARKRMEEELRESNERLQEAYLKLERTQRRVIRQERLTAMGEMASGIAHDFNNSLMSISGLSELLLKPGMLEDEAKVRRFLELILTAARDAKNIVSRLREFYRPKSDEEEFQPILLNALVEEAVSLTQPRWKTESLEANRTVRIALELQSALEIAGNETELREVLINLIFNAVDAMPDGGVITIRTRSVEGSIRLEVSDTGIGMSEEARHRCLEPFYSTKGSRGTGLGLSVAQGIVQRHRGTLQVESEPGRGSTFLLQFPEWDRAHDRAIGTPGSAAIPRSLRLLIVEDEKTIREVLQDYLSEAGHRVDTAADGVEGLKRNMEGHYDLLITDNSLPEMSGEEMAWAIKKISPRLPILMLTGLGDFAGEPRGRKGVDLVLTKPIQLSELDQAIWSLIASAA